MRPSDTCSVSVNGEKLLKMWKYSADHGLKSQPLLPPKVESKELFTDHAWVPYSALVATTSSAKIYICFPRVPHAKAKAISKAVSGGGLASSSSSSTKSKEVSSSTTGSATASASSWAYDVVQVVDMRETQPTCGHLELTSLVSTEKGFAVCSSIGQLYLYEYRDIDAEPFVCSKRFEDDEAAHFISMTLSPGGEDLLLTTLQRQVVGFPFGKSSIISEKENQFKRLPFALHRNSICSLALCSLRPLAVTLCKDGLLQIINYTTLDCELQHRFTEPALSAAIHPAGMLLVVAHRDKIKLLAILLHGLKGIGEVALHGCTRVAFTAGGHYFCCLTQSTLYVFATYSAQIVHTLPADSGYMRSLFISHSDQFVTAADSDGNVSTWALTEGNPAPELSVTVDQAQVRDALLCASSRQILVTCADDILRIFRDGKFQGEVGSARGQRVTAVLLSPDETCLFVGYSSGNIRLFEWPILKAKARARFTEYAAHGAAVEHLRLSADGGVLASAGADGSLLLFHMAKRKGAGKSAEHAFALSTDVVLVSRSFLNEQEGGLLAAKKQLVDEKHSQQFVLSRKDAEWQEKLKTEREQLALKLDQERYSREELQDRFDKFAKKEGEEREERHVNAIKQIQHIENQYERRLAAAATRYDRLSEDLESARQRHAQELKELDKELVIVRQAADKEISELRRMVSESDARVKEEVGVVRRRHEEMLRQQESEYEGEIVRVKESFRLRVAKDLEKAAVVEAKAIQHQNRIATLRNKLGEAKAMHAKVEKENKELAEKLRRAEEKIRQNAHELQERKGNARQTETHLAVLRSSNKTLDNFRYVLDYRIHQLTQEQGPTQQHIEGLQAHIREMYEEMMLHFNANKDHHQATKVKDAKIQTLSNEINKLRHSLAHKQRQLSSLIYSISSAARTGDPKVAHTAIADMYKLHVLNRGSASVDTSSTQEDQAQPSSSMEGLRQRLFLEKTILALKKSLEIANAKVKDKGHRNLKQNAALIAECNRLRKELVRAQHKVFLLNDNPGRRSTKHPPTLQSPHAQNQRPATVQGPRGSSRPSESSSTSRPAHSETAAKPRPKTSQSRSKLPNTLPAMTGQRPSTTSSSFQRKPSRTAKGKRDDLVLRLLEQLDENTREIAMQRSEIARLRAEKQEQG